MNLLYSPIITDNSVHVDESPRNTIGKSYTFVY